MNTARGSVNKWVSNYLSNGLSGLDNKLISGRPPKLNPSQLEQLSTYIKTFSTSDKGGRLTGEDIVAYIYSQFNVKFHPDHIYRMLKKLGFSWVTSRSRHPKQSQQCQEAFKKVPSVNDPSHPI